jgi:hypothetical protein
VGKIATVESIHLSQKVQFSLSMSSSSSSNSNNNNNNNNNKAKGERNCGENRFYPSSILN